MILDDAEVMSAIDTHGTASRSYQIRNTDRSAFARISGNIAKKYGDAGFKGKLDFTLTGAGEWCILYKRGYSSGRLGGSL